jgi:hypothetical protein
MRKNYEKYIEGYIDHRMFMQLWTGHYLGELPTKLEELGIELGKQFNDLEEFSIQLEEQSTEHTFRYWGLR